MRVKQSTVLINSFVARKMNRRDPDTLESSNMSQVQPETSSCRLPIAELPIGMPLYIRMSCSTMTV